MRLVDLFQEGLFLAGLEKNMQLCVIHVQVQSPEDSGTSYGGTVPYKAVLQGGDSLT